MAENTQNHPDNPYRAALAGARPALSSVILFSAILNVLMLTGSLYMLQVYDRVLPGGSVPTLVVLFGIVIICFTFLGFYDFLRARLLSRIALRLDDQLSGFAFRKWLDAGLPSAQNPADAQVMRDLDTLRGYLSGPAVSAFADILFVPLFLGVLFLIHPLLGILTIAGAMLGGVIALVNRAMTRNAISETVGLDATERNFNSRSQRNVEVIQAMGMHEVIAKQWQKLHHSTLAVSQKGSDPSEILAASSRAFRMLLQSSILTLGALLVLRGEISAGMIIASSVLSGRALAPVDQLIGQWRATGAFMAAHKRLETAFASGAGTPERINLPDPTGQISVDKLTKLGGTLKNGERKAILSEVTFALEAGDALGVVGHSASGKSTLARILVGADQGDEGQIRLDGATLDQWDPAQLGRNIGYLPQLVDMLPGTVQENISRFQESASDEAVIAAAMLTGIHDMILKLPDGYNTRLGDPDSPPMLSGGQMQRLGLARAIYDLPKLVVLDEPNANLDIAGDAALANVIRQLRDAGSTVIVIAHRPNVLEVVNKLMVLNGGEVGVFGDRDLLMTDDFKIRATPLEAPVPPSVTAPAALQKPVDPQASPYRAKRSGVGPVHGRKTGSKLPVRGAKPQTKPQAKPQTAPMGMSGAPPKRGPTSKIVPPIPPQDIPDVPPTFVRPSPTRAAQSVTEQAMQEPGVARRMPPIAPTMTSPIAAPTAPVTEPQRPPLKAATAPMEAAPVAPAPQPAPQSISVPETPPVDRALETHIPLPKTKSVPLPDPVATAPPAAPKPATPGRRRITITGLSPDTDTPPSDSGPSAQRTRA